jgi:hypothetical protein
MKRSGSKLLTAGAGFILLLFFCLVVAGAPIPSSAVPQGLSSPHIAGVDSCDSCHLIHGSERNASDLVPLRGSDPSSTCLRCHARIFKVLSRDGTVFSPGGDFFWLTRDFSNRQFKSPAASHGHNIIALDYGLVGDARLAVAPGDGSVTYRAEWLGCTSCHDPHAKIRYDPNHERIAGNYRLLGGIGYKGGGRASGFRFRYPAPIARAYPPAGENWPPEADDRHVDYGSGLSEWCTNCHAGFAVGGDGPQSSHRHPSGNDARLGDISRAYDHYQASGRLEGRHGSAYDHLVPFEKGETDLARLDPFSTVGPEAGANVMCLSCHRAHASPFADIGRWDFRVTFLKNSPVLSSPEGRHAYYRDRIATRYNDEQRSLCNKCHLEDCNSCHLR